MNYILTALGSGPPDWGPALALSGAAEPAPDDRPTRPLCLQQILLGADSHRCSNSPTLHPPSRCPKRDSCGTPRRSAGSCDRMSARDTYRTKHSCYLIEACMHKATFIYHLGPWSTRNRQGPQFRELLITAWTQCVSKAEGCLLFKRVTFNKLEKPSALSALKTSQGFSGRSGLQLVFWS
jgi:hypothetical protein